VIPIKKPEQGPDILRRRGIPATRQLCEQHDVDPEAQKTFEFNSKIYGDTSVKQALRKAQHDKCALCESKISHISHGDVEHFRPKAGHRQEPEGALGQPGYYWLAYEWTNFLFCCQLCNQVFKGNLFPLANPAHRAKSHHEDINDEGPLLVNPAIEDPARFIEFRKNLVHAVGGNPRGVATIKVFGLNRKELEDKRLSYFLFFRQSIPHIVALINTRETIASLVEKHPSPEHLKDLAEVEAQIEQFIGDSAEYAAMVRAALRARNLP
jgi:uncharacterized protein (TIGR02646 family)